jgi:microcystin-dependent protein
MSVDNFAYFATTKPDSLASAMTNTATSVVLVSGTSFPDPALNGGKQYTIILAYGTDREEVCTVTAKPTVTTLTVLRGQDGTAATSKNAGDVVVHGVSAREFNSIATKLPKSGGTMTGPLVLAGNASAVLEAVPKQQLDAAVPLGAIMAYGGATAPTGWHLCDGTAHGSSALQTLLGSANTPNLVDRFIKGAGTGVASGSTGGEKAHILSVAEMPSHAHGGSTLGMSANQSHSHSVEVSFQEVAPLDWDVSYGGNAIQVQRASARVTSAANTDHVHVVPVEGNGAAHNNEPQFYALTYIIKKV